MDPANLVRHPAPKSCTFQIPTTSIAAVSISSSRQWGGPSTREEDGKGGSFRWPAIRAAHMARGISGKTGSTQGVKNALVLLVIVHFFQVQEGSLGQSTRSRSFKNRTCSERMVRTAKVLCGRRRTREEEHRPLLRRVPRRKRWAPTSYTSYTHVSQPLLHFRSAQHSSSRGWRACGTTPRSCPAPIRCPA
jgi:hypothetical protein